MAKQWTDEDIDALHVYFENGYSDEEIAEALGFSQTETIAKKRRALGLMRRTRVEHWTKKTLAILHDPANQHLTNAEMGELVHADQSTVYRKRKELGLPTCTLRRWTEEELAVLREHYPKKSTRFVAKQLGRPDNAVRTKAWTLGITRQEGV